MKQLYLHGLGQERNSWSETLANMSTSDNAIPVDLVGLLNGKVATYEIFMLLSPNNATKKNSSTYVVYLSEVFLH